MKILLASILISIFLSVEKSCTENTEASSEEKDTSASALSDELIPFTVGNYWVYKDSVWEEGKLISVTIDTVKITNKGNYNGHTTYEFNDGKEWFANGDTIFQLYQQRTQIKFHSPVLIASEKPIEFSCLYGGDVVIQKTASKIPCADDRWKSSACYEMKDACGSFTAVVFGIGIVKEKRGDCFSGSENYSTRTLMDYKIQ